MWMSTIPELNIIDVNQSAQRQYGYTREEFLRLNSMDLRQPEEEETVKQAALEAYRTFALKSAWG